VLLRVDNHAPYEASLVLWLAGERPFLPHVEKTDGTGTPHLDTRPFAPRDPALLAAWRADAVPAPPPAGPALRIELHVDDGGQWATLRIDLGGLADAAWARGRADLANPKRVQVCGLVPGDRDPRAAFATGFGPEAAPFLGAGWNAPDPEGFRWSAEPRADVLVPLETPAPRRLRLRAMPLSGGALKPGRVAVALNGVALGEIALAAGFASYELEVPAAAQRPGTNRLSLSVDRAVVPKDAGLGSDERHLGVAVSDLALTRQ